MKATNKKAYDALIRARTVLLVSQPFFGCLALHLELVEEVNHPVRKTMWVDGIHMGYNPDFVLGLSEQELQGVCAHEVMHCAFQHMTRRQHRHPVIWNCAADYLINSCLLKAGFKLPGNAIAHKNPDPTARGHLHDPKFDGMSSEEIYELIRQDMEKKLQKLAQQQKGGQGGKDKNKGQGSQGDGDGKGDQDVDVFGGCGGVYDAGQPGDKHGQDAVGREWDANVRMAVNVAKRANAGTVPGYLERLVTALEEPKVSWREVTRQFIDQSMSKDYSWSKPNRRFISRGMTLPGFISDALHHLVMVLDVSGSVDEKMMQTFVSEVAGALNDGTADKLTVLYADTEVRKVDEFTPGDIVACKTVGGGGTCFNDSFRWIKDNASDAACIVYLTDMLTGSFGEDLGIPTLWAAFLPAAQLATITPPFGTKIAVDTSE